MLNIYAKDRVITRYFDGIYFWRNWGDDEKRMILYSADGILYKDKQFIFIDGLEKSIERIGLGAWSCVRRDASI
jgi:hypothetical protein